MIRRGGEAGALANLVTSKNYTALDLYQHYNVGVKGWPYNLPPPPYPSHLKAFIYAALKIEGEDMESKSRLARQRQESTRHPRSKFNR